MPCNVKRRKNTISTFQLADFATYAFSNGYQGSEYVFEFSGHEANQLASLQCFETLTAGLCNGSRWTYPWKPAKHGRILQCSAHLCWYCCHRIGWSGFWFCRLWFSTTGSCMPVFVPSSGTKCSGSRTIVINGFGFLHCLLQLRPVCATYTIGTDWSDNFSAETRWSSTFLSVSNSLHHFGCCVELCHLLVHCCEQSFVHCGGWHTERSVVIHDWNDDVWGTTHKCWMDWLDHEHCGWISVFRGPCEASKGCREEGMTVTTLKEDSAPSTWRLKKNAMNKKELMQMDIRSTLILGFCMMMDRQAPEISHVRSAKL